MTCLPRGLALLLCVSPLWAQSGQVRVVDDTPGPGVDFTDLRVAARSAGPGDILLLKEGDYTFLDAGNRPLLIPDGLVIVSEEDARVRGELQVRLDPAQVLGMRGVHIRSDPPPPGYFKGFRLSSVASRGMTWVEDVVGVLDSSDFRFYGPLGKAGSGVTLQRCVTSAVLSTGASFSAYDTVFREIGLSLFDQSLAVSRSDVLISRGLFLPDANLLDCDALLIQHQGPVTANKAPIFSAGPARSYQASAIVREGDNVHVSFLGEPGDRVFMVVGTQPRSLYLPAFEGTLLVDPPFTIAPFFGGTLPANGLLNLSFPVTDLPGDTEGLPYFTQAIFVDASNRLLLGPGSMVVVVDASL